MVSIKGPILLLLLNRADAIPGRISFTRVLKKGMRCSRQRSTESCCAHTFSRAAFNRFFAELPPIPLTSDEEEDQIIPAHLLRPVESIEAECHAKTSLDLQAWGYFPGDSLCTYTCRDHRDRKYVEDGHKNPDIAKLRSGKIRGLLKKTSNKRTLPGFVMFCPKGSTAKAVSVDSLWKGDKGRKLIGICLAAIVDGDPDLDSSAEDAPVLNHEAFNTATNSYRLEYDLLACEDYDLSREVIQTPTVGSEIDLDSDLDLDLRLDGAMLFADIDLTDIGFGWQSPQQ